jgi:D-beta-D-heptose 7-phosphate kinase/D-beta-D-heptose 1-phosphate adenosyltransferase
MVKVWVNGSFDVLHIGHIKLLEYASSVGKVTVGIDSDERIKSMKGNNRPFNNQQDRKFFLESLRYVSRVNVFNTDEELENIIKIESPDFMVVGNDYSNKKIIGSQYIKNILFFEKLDGFSTSKILNYGKTYNM